MVRRKPFHKRSKTEGSAASVSAAASTPIASAASSSVVNNSGSKKRKFPLKRSLLRRSTSAPPNNNNDQDGGQTESIRSIDELSSSAHRSSAMLSSYSRQLQHQHQQQQHHVVDDGTPSSSAVKDLQRVLKMIEEERHLVAYDLYIDAKRRIIDDSIRSQGATTTSSTLSKKSSISKVSWKSPPERSSANPGSIYSDDEQAWIFLQEKREEFQALEVCLLW